MSLGCLLSVCRLYPSMSSACAHPSRYHDGADSAGASTQPRGTGRSSAKKPKRASRSPASTAVTCRVWLVTCATQGAPVTCKGADLTHDRPRAWRSPREAQPPGRRALACRPLAAPARYKLPGGCLQAGTLQVTPPAGVHALQATPLLISPRPAAAAGPRLLINCYSAINQLLFGY